MKILIATDGSEFSRAAIERGCQMAKEHKGTEIKVISVYEFPRPLATEPFAMSAEYCAELDKLASDQANTWAKDAVDLIGKILDGSNVAVTSVVEQGTPARSIIDTATAWNADLIVMGSHGRGFWGRLTLGSVSDAVVHHAPCSVLIAKAEQKAKAVS